ncbi:MAG: bifunctional chorismate mutase/prephenate dehydratase [Christensenellales bacterium]|jgi:chorismate mutase/prephenate dehydratase
MTDIKKLRQEIDNIDGKLKDLFIRRLKVSEQVAQQKLTLNTPVYDKRREEEILSGLAGEEYANYLSGQFNLVMRNSRNIQYKSIAEQKNISYAANAQKEIKEETVFIQGMPGSYSDIISEKKYQRTKFVYKQYFEQVFKAVEEKDNSVGVLPMVNSTAGMVGEVFQYLYKYNVYISALEALPVSHCLLACHSDFAKIKYVISHPQALAQCRAFIEKHNLIPIPNDNTARASEYVRELQSEEYAAISSEECARLYKLTVLQKNLSDMENNTTRFAFITNKPIVNAECDRISVIFELDNTAGALNNVLSTFGSLNININALHSMPHKQKPFAFNFYAEFTGNLNDKDIIALLYQLENELPYIKITGSFKGA